MKICGVEIKNTEAVISIIEHKDNLFHIADCRVRKVDFSKDYQQKDLKYFQKTFAKLIEDYQVDLVVYKQRPLKGKFAGGALGFKIEAAIELIDNLVVKSMGNAEIKDCLKRNPLNIDLQETGLKVFQKTAFETAYAYQMKTLYPE